MARRVMLLVSSVCFAALASACFDVEEPPPPPTDDAVIAGKILVSTATGQAVVDRNAVQQQRVDVTLAGRRTAAPTTAQNAATIPTPTSRPVPADAPLRPRHSKVPLEWKAGDVLVLFEPRAYDKESIGKAMERMIGDAGLAGVKADVARCTAHLYCKVRLHKDTPEGERLLDEAETAHAALALDKARAPRVKVVARNMKKSGQRVPSDPLLSFQWHYDFIHMGAAWDIETGDPDLVIAVVDSGIVSAHPDLTNRLARDPVNGTLVGADIISDGNIDIDEFAGRDTNPEDPGDGFFGDQGSSYHGTHIAGIIGAETDNGQGTAGVSWDSKIVPVRVLGENLQGFDDDIVDGIFWAIGDPNVEGVPDNVSPARIVNLSLGGPSDEASQLFWEEAVQFIFDDADGIYDRPILIAAAGNTDEDAGLITPANVPGMITVAATNISGLRASYSNYGDTVDVTAPGGDDGTDLNSDGQPDTILSAVNNEYDFRVGTSMAAPHVTGVVALLVSANPALTQTSVESILKSSADSQGICSEGCGAGWLDAVGALVLAGGEVQAEPFLTTDVTQVFYSLGIANKQVAVLNLGNAPFSFTATIEGPQADLFSVDVAEGTVPAAPDGRVLLNVSLARGAFEAGSANLKITSTDLDPEQTTLVNLGFNDDTSRTPRQIQTVEVAAYVTDDAGQLQKVASGLAERANGFAYQITGLPAGDYKVYAVGDDNGDGTYAADLESFGAYPTRVQPRVITLAEDQQVSDIDFGIDAAFITDIVGGVGAPCDDANDCTFAPDADCITSFSGGYCSRLCGEDGFCGENASCEALECDGAPCDVCLVRCSSDTQCRFGDGYVCDALGGCTPAGFTDG